MVDIVQKLRAYRPRTGWPEEYSTIVEPTMNHVAADEIERLRAENERLRTGLRAIAGARPRCCEISDAMQGIARTALDKPGTSSD